METPLLDDTLARFWAKVEDHSDPSACWRWTGAHSMNGYGKFWDGYRIEYAHRFAYVQEMGQIPEGLTIDHLCRVRDCVNPAHLEAVTHRENVLRGESPSALHARKTHCPQGHSYDEENTRVDGNGSRHCRECKRKQRRAAALEGRRI